MSREWNALVLDDYPIARIGLEMVAYKYCPKGQIVQAGTVGEAISCLEQMQVNLVIAGVNPETETAFDFLRWIRAHKKGVKVLILSGSNENRDFSKARDLGVDGYILKKASLEEIVYGINTIEKGEKYYSSSLVESTSKRNGSLERIRELTKREQEVLHLLSLGYSNEKISKTLYISEGTTKKHITSILGKLGVKSRVQAAIYVNCFGKGELYEEKNESVES